ncbi:MAG: TonB-dependent receptor [Acidipila sp.]|nr:TonB-dependent receptor [Acidipila sp.]
MKTKRLWNLVVAAVFGILCVLPMMSYAQAISGDIVGTVTDKSGGAVPGATVTAENVATGVKSSTTTNDHGEYRLGNLPVGTYNIHAVAANFAETTMANFVVELNKTQTAALVLQVGQQVTTIEVSGAPPPINTTSPQIEGTFDKQAASDSPVASIGFGVLNLALLEPGVASSGGLGAGTGPSVGGQRPRNNNFTIEGVDNNNKGVTGPLVTVPNDAVEEFSALQNQFSPEFGHSTGGQYNTIVVSGTNQFHGKAYEYFNNRNLDAIDESTIQSGFTSNPRNDFNRYGGQVGGPIVKNKLFFFANYEMNTLGQLLPPGGQTCAPTAAGYAALTAITGPAGLSATNVAQLAKYVAPAPASTSGTCNTNVNGTDPAGNANTNNQIFVTNPGVLAGFTGIDVGVLSIPALFFQNTKLLTTSMDYDFSAKDQIRGRYVYNSLDALDNAANLPIFFQLSPTRYHLVSLAEYHTFNSAVQNEIRLSFNRYENHTPTGNFIYPGLDQFPNIGLGDLGINVGPDPNGPQFAIQNYYSATDNVSWVKGNHTFKFGMDLHKYIAPQQFTQRARGDYEYNTADIFLHDQNPDFLAQRSLGSTTYYGDQIGIFWYVNDNWKIRHNLTINLGLRHEYTTIPVGERRQALNSAASVPGLIDFSEPRAPKKNFMPRVGFAWSPGSKGTTSVRAGFGMGYDVLYDNIGTLEKPPQLSGTVDQTFPPLINNYLANGAILPSVGDLQSFTPATANCVAHGVAAGLPCQRFSSVNHLIVDQKDPVAVEWNLSVQHSFGSKYSVEVRYLGTHGYHLNVQQHPNFRSRVDATHFLPTFLTAPSLADRDVLGTMNTLTTLKAVSPVVPAFAAAGFTQAPGITEFAPVGNSIYHGLAVQATRRISNGLQFTGAWTWSRVIDDSTADFNSTVLTPRRGQDFQNLRADRSVSALNRTHRITITANYDLPYFKSGNWLTRNVLGNWAFVPIYTYQSPEWATVQSATDSNLNGDTAGDRVLVNKAGVPGTGSGVTSLRDSAGEVVAYLVINPTAQYIRANPGALANNPTSIPGVVAAGSGLQIAGRNTLPTRPINNFDLTAVKKFNISESKRIEFQAQFSNILNHPQFVPGFVNRVDSVSFPAGISPGPQSFTRAHDGGFNQIQNEFSSNSRTIQLVVKLVF